MGEVGEGIAKLACMYCMQIDLVKSFGLSPPPPAPVGVCGKGSIEAVYIY